MVVGCVDACASLCGPIHTSRLVLHLCILDPFCNGLHHHLYVVRHIHIDIDQALSVHISKWNVCPFSEVFLIGWLFGVLLLVG